MKSEVLMEKPPAAERTRFERIQLEGGQLSVVRPLPPDFPPDFVDKLIKDKPWNKTGKVIDTSGRKPELFEIAGVKIFKKRSRLSGRQVQHALSTDPLDEGKSFVRENTPSAQMALVDRVKRKYKDTYGEDLLVEEPVAFYIRREETTKFTFYKGCKEIKPIKISRAARIHACNLVADIDERLEKIGVSRYEVGGNYVIVENPHDEYGIGVVLIDTESWTIKD